MTIETRSFIEFGDILGVELECSHCRTKMLFPSFNLEKLSVQCQNCRELFFDPKLGDMQALADLGNKLSELRQRKLKGIRLQIALPESA